MLRCALKRHTQLISHTRTLLSLGDIIAGVLLAFSEVGRGISMVRPASRRKFRYTSSSQSGDGLKKKNYRGKLKLAQVLFFFVDREVLLDWRNFYFRTHAISSLLMYFKIEIFFLFLSSRKCECQLYVRP